MIRMTSDTGRIGNIWWINSDQNTIVNVGRMFAGAHVHIEAVRWGSVGWDWNLRMSYEVLP